MENFNLDIFSPAVPVRLSTKNIIKEQLLNFKPFTAWAETLKASLALQRTEGHSLHDSPYTLRSVDVQSVDWFGPTNLGFLKLNAEVMNDKGHYLPGVAFLRGGSVAMLMILRPSDSNSERWVVMTEQPRIPAGSLKFWEIPAGMIDDKTENFVGKAAEEIEEETGLVVPQRELIDLTKLALEETDVEEGLQPAMYPSPGGCDEYIAIFLWEKVLD